MRLENLAYTSIGVVGGGLMALGLYDLSQAPQPETLLRLAEIRPIEPIQYLELLKETIQNISNPLLSDPIFTSSVKILTGAAMIAIAYGKAMSSIYEHTGAIRVRSWGGWV